MHTLRRPSNLTIRNARIQDAATIKRVVRSAHINPMDLDWPPFVIAECDGRIVGVGQIKSHGDGSRELASIAVIPEFQKQGIASAVIRTLLPRESGPLYLTCRSALETFYIQFGFQSIGPSEMPPSLRRRYNLVQLFIKLSRSSETMLVMRRDSVSGQAG